MALENATGEMRFQSELLKQEHAVSLEFALFIREKLQSVYCIPSASCSTKWNGLIFVGRGPYQGGIFRFQLTLPALFPHVTYPFNLKFTSSVYHPAVNQATGDIDANLLKFTCVDQCHAYKVISYAKEILEETDILHFTNCVSSHICTEYASNQEAFFNNVFNCVRQSREAIFDILPYDSHNISFTPWNPTLHDALRKRICESHLDRSCDVLSFVFNRCK
uniref:UBIQUITIN_CONJUGAT_2 domain-containing protein n=1 Tax=Trichuris muris TaxID=70415 RepID=A0A5S6Q8Q9_TRIMR